jgi:acyl-CoA reductase-like NAD-dependent aldehyde dehydrogenase
LCAGNTVIVRTSDSTPITGTLLEDLVRKAGFDNFEYQNVFSHPNQLELIMSHKHVKGVCFTGSTAAGRRIGEVAGRYIKK